MTLILEHSTKNVMVRGVVDVVEGGVVAGAGVLEGPAVAEEGKLCDSP